MRVLAGDIGGTNTRLQIAECESGRCRTVRDQRFASGSYASLASILHEFLQPERVRAISGVCLGVAGPVTETDAGQSVKVTNLPWEIRGWELAREFGFPALRLINDFQAIGYGIEALDAGDRVVLQPGTPVARAPRALIGAGTGLGQGILVWQGDHYAPIATEGGHAVFGPTNEAQIELARYLMRSHAHASYEFFLSGQGLAQLYAFLKERGDFPESAAVAAAMRADDPAAAITRAALEMQDPLANQTLDMFIDIYGAQAGNLALTAGATGGVYIAGGIAPRIMARLTDGRFMQAFLDKGRMRYYVAAIPVAVVTNPDIGLLGAVQAAGRMRAS
ncbi:MAG: glucokinase, partial [Sulfuricaulis sp.]